MVKAHSCIEKLRGNENYRSALRDYPRRPCVPGLTRVSVCFWGWLLHVDIEFDGTNLVPVCIFEWNPTTLATIASSIDTKTCSISLIYTTTSGSRNPRGSKTVANYWFSVLNRNCTLGGTKRFLLSTISTMLVDRSYRWREWVVTNLRILKRGPWKSPWTRSTIFGLFLIPFGPLQVMSSKQK